MAENETQKMLKTVLVMQADILGRLERIEKAVGTDRDPAIDPRFESLAELESWMTTDLGDGLRDHIDDLVSTVNGGR